jgi:hypothetical protein
VLLCATPQEYGDGLERLLDATERQRIADKARMKAQDLFGVEAVKHIVSDAIGRVTRR